MKKILIMVLSCCLMALSMTGCGSNKDTVVLTPDGDVVIHADGSASNVTKTEDKEEQQETKNKKSDSDLIQIGFAQVGSESGWRFAQTQSMKETFTEENGYKLNFVDCNNDQNVQKDTISQFVKDGMDYIILDPIVEDGYDDVLQEAKDAEIPVLVVDRNITADESLYECWVGSDFKQEGIDAAAWLAEHLEQNNRGSKNLNIVTILGSPNSSATIGRTDGFHEGAKEHSNWKLIDEQTGDFTEEGGKAVMKAFLKQHKNIDVVVCQNDDEAFGAIEAIQDAGKTCGPKGDIIIISFDATKNAFQRMVDGEINVDVECNPLEGPLVADLIQKLKNGEAVERTQYMEEGVFPAEEAADVIDSRTY